MIRLVILDIEGVLNYPDGSQCSWPMEGLLKVRSLVKQTPLVCVLCSGRQEPYGEAVVQALDFFFPFPEERAARFERAWGGRLASYPSIFENGAYFYDPIVKRPIRSPLLTDEHVRRLREMQATSIAELVEGTGCQIEPGKDFCISLNPPLRPGSKERLTTDEFRPVVDEALRGWTEWVDIKHSGSAVDITPKGISKASAVKFLLENTGFAPEEVLGVGDTAADEEWLSVVGWSAAPANGKGKLKNVHYFSDKEVTDGLLDILENLRAHGYERVG